ncbi:hypothetical protein MBANPS3_003458 [Mucor bainieri]
MSLEQLPSELLGHIFGFIDSVQHLAECRLVCKRLNLPAERVMFTKPLVISSASTANALHYHLERNQEMGNLIKSLRVENDNDTETQEFAKLLPLLLTPGLESLQGYVKGSVFFKCMVEVAEIRNEKYHRLKVLPTELYHNSSEEYYKAISIFRETLEHVNIAVQYPSEIPWHVVSQLADFTNLTSLNIGGGVDSVQDLNGMLAPCTRLQDLTVETCGSIHDAMSKGDLLEWVEEHHVEKVGTLTKIKIQGSLQPDIVEYLAYKYPKVTEAVMTIHGDSAFHEEAVVILSQVADIYEAFDRVVDAVQNIPICAYHYQNIVSSAFLQGVEYQIVSNGRQLLTLVDKYDTLDSLNTVWAIKLGLLPALGEQIHNSLIKRTTVSRIDAYHYNTYNSNIGC